MPLDSTPVLSILDRATDANGAIVPGAILEFYEAGTSTPKTVYSNATLATSLGTSVTCDSGGYPTSDGSTKTMIYVGTASYKMIVKTSAGVALITHDNIPGAPAIPATEDSALPETPVITRTSTTTITAGNFETYRGRLVNADPSGGSFAIQLPPPVSAGDGWRMGVRLSGSTTNVVTIRASGATIAKPGQTGVTSFALSGVGHTVWISCDGAGFIVDSETPPFFGNSSPYVTIADRLTAPPSSPTGGARYIVNGTATGVWSTLGFVEHDIAESDGNGSWIRTTPKDGWLAYVADESLLVQFRVSSWTDLNNITAPSASNLKMMDLYYDGTSTNTIASATWTKVPTFTVGTNTITGASHASGVVTLPTGSYLVVGIPSLVATTGSNLIRGRLYSTTSAATKITSINVKHTVLTSADNWAAPIVLGSLTVSAATENFELQVFSNLSSTVFGAADTSAEAEKFASLQIISLASQQGPQGIQGIQGPGGLDAAYAFQWSTTTGGDPGSGKIRGNNVTIASITELGVSETGADGAALAAVLATWDDGSSTIRGKIKVQKEGATQNFAEFHVTGSGTDAGSYWTFPVTYVGAGGTLANGDDLAALFIPKGDKGDPGTTVPDPAGLTAITDFDDETDYLIGVDTSSGSSTVKLLGKNLGFTQAGTGAVLRRLQSKARDWIDARDFGLSASASAANNLTYLQAAITAAGALGRSRLILPHGAFDIAGALTSSASNIAIEGPGKTAALLVQKTVSAATLTMTGQRVKLKGFGVYYDTAGTSGGDAFRLENEYPNLSDLWAVNAYRSYVMVGANQSVVRDIEGSNHVVNGLLAQSVVGGKFSNIMMNAGTGSNASLGNIRLVDQVEALMMVNVELLSGLYSITTDAAAPGFGTRPAWNSFVGFYCDAADRGSLISHLYGSEFVSSWFSGGRSGSGYNGATFASCKYVSFPGTKFVNCGAHGAQVNSSSSHMDFSGATFDSNSVTTGSGVSDGLRIDANTNDIVANYPKGGNNLVTGGQQAYDVRVAAGTSGRVVIRIASAGGVTGIASHGGTGSGNIMEVNGTLYNGGPIIPFTNDGGALGASGQGWSDLFLASGGVINWNAGTYTLTQSGSTLTTSGAFTSGGVLTANGNLVVAGDLTKNVTNGNLAFYGGNAFDAGAGIVLYGETHATTPDRIWLVNNNFTTRLIVDQAGNFAIGNAALSTSAADGFVYIPTCAGTPTGTPTSFTGLAPIIVNTTNNKLYFYSGGAWRDAGP